jgi:hypothetical protein
MVISLAPNSATIGLWSSPLTASPITFRSRAVNESKPAAQMFKLHPLLALRTVTFQDKKTVRDLQTTRFHQN